MTFFDMTSDDIDALFDDNFTALIDEVDISNVPTTIEFGDSTIKSMVDKRVISFHDDQSELQLSSSHINSTENLYLNCEHGKHLF